MRALDAGRAVGAGERQREMEFKSIVVALILLAVLFGWYAWLAAAERRRARDRDERGR